MAITVDTCVTEGNRCPLDLCDGRLEARPTAPDLGMSKRFSPLFFLTNPRFGSSWKRNGSPINRKDAAEPVIRHSWMETHEW
jgi:hypothetical protein